MGGGGGGLWEGGDLQRLSLVDDEEPNPRKFFLMSVLRTRVRLLLFEARVVFLQAEIDVLYKDNIIFGYIFRSDATGKWQLLV